MAKTASGGRSTSANTSSVDQTTQDYLKQIMDAARGSGMSGPSPLVGASTGYNSAAMNAGQTGMSALAGDPNATAQLMNPYQQQVIDAMRQQGAVTDANTTNNLNSAATQAGAFGGSRQGVAQGVALGENARNMNSNIAGLLQTGYGDAMNRAGSLASMGFAGAGANANLGMGGVGSPQQWLLQQLRSGFVMPTGTQSNGSQANVGTEVKTPNLFKMFG